MSKVPIQLSEEALFRHQVVSEVGSRVLWGMAVGDAIAEVLGRDHQDLLGRSRRLSERTVYRWLEAFRRGGVAALEPTGRERIATSKALSEKMVRYLKAQKLLDAKASVPEIIRLAQETGVVGDGEVSRTSAWRACKRMGLPLHRPRRRAECDMRRFAYPHRMMMVLADGKHFRAGSERLRRVAMTLLDDSTRLGLAVVVGTSESTELFLKALHEAICRFGLMITLFLDNGPGFISLDTRTVLAGLGIQLIHGTPAYPQGHGKVERYHRRLAEQVLRGWDGNPAVDPDPGALTLRLTHWLTEVYNRDPHHGLDGDSPLARWDADERDLVFPSDGFRRHFVVSCDRTVSSDNVISYEGVAYEVPRGHAGKVIAVSRHLLEGNALSVVHEGHVVTLHPVDLAANARAHRARRPSPEDAFSANPPETAATARFAADHKSLVDADGGYKKGPDDE